MEEDDSECKGSSDSDAVFSTQESPAEEASNSPSTKRDRDEVMQNEEIFYDAGADESNGSNKKLKIHTPSESSEANQVTVNNISNHKSNSFKETNTDNKNGMCKDSNADHGKSNKHNEADKEDCNENETSGSSPGKAERSGVSSSADGPDTVAGCSTDSSLRDSGAGSSRGVRARRGRVYRTHREDSSDEETAFERALRNQRSSDEQSGARGGRGRKRKVVRSRDREGTPSNPEPASTEHDSPGYDTSRNTHSDTSSDDSDTLRARRHRWSFLNRASDDGLSVNSGSSDSESEPENSETVEKEIQEEVTALMAKSAPKRGFALLDELRLRQYQGAASRVGCCGRSPVRFTQRFSCSLRSVQRLSLLATLDGHSGCVNSVGFSSARPLLVSGSDDLKLAMWDWATRNNVAMFDSGHTNNVFQTKFTHYSSDRSIITCARDGQVRLCEVSDAVVTSTRRLARHNGAVHKIALTPDRPNVVLSAGEDGLVKESDTRDGISRTVASVKGPKNETIGLYSVHIHPRSTNEYCVSGKDATVSVMDRRFPCVTADPLQTYRASGLRGRGPHVVTCAVYTSDGDAIVASYNDNDVYMFDTAPASQEHGQGAVGGSSPPHTSHSHRYSGHRNSATIKGVATLGPHSEYVMSGSDCGNVFIWERHSEAIVRVFHGDENGVVNVLEPHPHVPLLATSGLDQDVKLWSPQKEGKDEGFPRQLVEDNLRQRRQSALADYGDGHFLGVIMEHMRRMRGRGEPGEDADMPQLQCVNQ